MQACLHTDAHAHMHTCTHACTHTHTHTHALKNSFHICALLTEFSATAQPGPAIVELAADGGWADEFLAAENSLPEDAAWAAEFDATRPAVPSLHDMKWAAEYLDQSEQPEQHVW